MGSILPRRVRLQKLLLKMISGFVNLADTALGGQSIEWRGGVYARDPASKAMYGAIIFIPEEGKLLLDRGVPP